MKTIFLILLATVSFSKMSAEAAAAPAFASYTCEKELPSTVPPTQYAYCEDIVLQVLGPNGPQRIQEWALEISCQYLSNPIPKFGTLTEETACPPGSQPNFNLLMGDLGACNNSQVPSPAWKEKAGQLFGAGEAGEAKCQAALEAQLQDPKGCPVNANFQTGVYQIPCVPGPAPVPVTIPVQTSVPTLPGLPSPE